jgi:hypothetical protein
MTPEEIAKKCGARPSRVREALAARTVMGRPPPPSRVLSVADVEQWLDKPQPNTLRVARECIRFLLDVIKARGK